MKKFVFFCLAAILMANGLLFAQANDPAIGFWISVDDKSERQTAGWQTYVEGGKLFGKMLSAPGAYPNSLATMCKQSYGRDFPRTGDVRQLPVLGTPWLYNLSPTKEAGRWDKGKIIDVSADKNAPDYTGAVTFYQAGTTIPRGAKVRAGNNNGGKFRVDTLEMRGSFLGIGRSQYWEKATQQAASNVR